MEIHGLCFIGHACLIPAPASHLVGPWPDTCMDTSRPVLSGSSALRRLRPRHRPGVRPCAQFSPADVESNLKDFRTMNLCKHLSRRPVMPRVLTCQTWIALDGKYQGGQCHISLFLAGGVCSGGGPAWGLGCRICRLCYNPNGNNEHGGPWAQLDVRGSIQKCNIQKHQKPLVTKTRKQRSSRRLPDVITIPWFKLSSWHRPWNTSSRSSAS